MQQVLKGLRIAATLPPEAWFGSVDYLFSRDMIGDLLQMGAAVFEVPIEPFDTRNDAQIEDCLTALQSFRPDLVIAYANAGYPLLCTTADGRNIFRDVLQIPTVMLWDHGPLQFARLLLGKLPDAPADATSGCIARLREAIDHPLYIHYSPDRGHIATLERLGVLSASKVRFFLQPAYPCYVRHGLSHPINGSANENVIFAGNVYIESAANLAFAKTPAIDKLQKRVFAAKRDRLTASLWDLLRDEIGVLDAAAIQELALSPDSSYFWGLVRDLIEIAGNTEVRTAVLTGLQHKLRFFGNFVEPEAQTILRDRYGFTYGGSVNCVTDLPHLFSSSAITVEVINLGYNTGSSPKITACLASGGLPLFDYKPDFHLAMGDAGEQVMYRSIDHLNSLVEHYLTNPGQRREVIGELQAQVLERFTFGGLMRQILVDEPVWRNALKTA